MDKLIDETVKSAPITRDEALIMIEDLRDKFDDIGLDNRNGEDRLKKKQDFLKNFVDKQLSERDRYEHIFKTEGGSFYFILRTGESFRMKMNSDSEYDLIQPLLEKVLFVDEKQHDELVKMFSDKRNQEGRTVGFKINTQNLKVE